MPPDEAPVDDLRASIKAAMTTDPAPAAPDPAPAAATPPPAAETPAKVPAEGVAAEGAQSIPAASTGEPVRDEQGRFAKPGEAAQQTPPVEAAASEAAPETPSQGTIQPPPTWTPEAKSKFADADPAIQKEVLRREGQMNEAMGNWRTKGERLNKIDAVIAPRRDKWALGGADEVTGIQRLIAAEEYLEKNPHDGIRYLAQQYGVNLAELAGAQGYSGQQGQPGQQQPVYPGQGQQPQPGAQPQQLQLASLPPELQGLIQEVSTLKTTLTQQQQRDAEAKQSAFVAEAEAFAAEPGRTYFPDLADDMALLLENGRAKTLPEAYDMAAHMRPDIRALILADERKADAARATAAQRAKASDAQRAAGSVTGSPGLGESAATDGPAPSLREEIRRSMAGASSA